LFDIFLLSRRWYVCHIFSENIFFVYTSIGFNHSAFALRNEGRLQNSPYFSKHIPRGELIELLSKALLYLEVESHWRNDELTTKCKTGFSLLESHVCSLDASAPKSAQSGAMELNESSIAGGSSVAALAHKSTTDPSQANFETGSLREALPLHEQVLLKQNQTLAPAVDGLAKRKNSPVLIDGPAEKRARRGSPDMDVDVNSDCNLSSLCRKLALINVLQPPEQGARCLITTAST
jgi:transducin (beta)-like 1